MNPAARAGKGANAVRLRAALPLNFQASGLAAGIKRSGKLDLALFYSCQPAKAAAVFTANRIQAAPLKVCQRHLKSNRAVRAIIVNSGNANCFTGKRGIKDAEEMSRALADKIGVKKESVLVASTGIIARRLPLAKIKSAIPALVQGLSHKGIDKAKKAILTTDTFAKEVTLKFKLGSRTATICGVAKGAGMIAPDLATMLAFIFTDAKIGQEALRKALKAAIGDSFNCITIDGCMSTNDMVIALANGAADNSIITGGKNLALFTRSLKTVCAALAKLIVRDAEGATKLVRIRVDKAASIEEAKRAALGIANSNLFKTAVFAASPNILGRIVAGIGASGTDVKEEGLKISFSPLKNKEVDIRVSLHRGKSSATVYTSDLTYEYIKINAEYN